MTVTNLLFEPSGCNLPFQNDVIVWPALEMIPRVASPWKDGCYSVLVPMEGWTLFCAMSPWKDGGYSVLGPMVGWSALMSWEMGGLEKVRTAPTMELPQEHTYTLTHTHTETQCFHQCLTRVS